jgi:hypothetical protein
MVRYRSAQRIAAAALAVVSLASLAACTAGATVTDTTPASPTAVGGSVFRPSPPPPLGAFPIPRGAQVEDVVYDGGYGFHLGNVTAAAARGFYATALPAAGYTITRRASSSGNGATITAIEFTGHGYQGSVGTISITSSFSGLYPPGLSGFTPMPGPTDVPAMSPEVGDDVVSIAIMPQ